MQQKCKIRPIIRVLPHNTIVISYPFTVALFSSFLFSQRYSLWPFFMYCQLNNCCAVAEFSVALFSVNLISVNPHNTTNARSAYCVSFFNAFALDEKVFLEKTTNEIL